MTASLQQGFRPHVDSTRATPLPPGVVALRVAAAAGLAALLAFGTASAQQVAERNGVLTDASGRTLYTFDLDAPKKSACGGGCADAWPPFYAKDGATGSGAFTVITRNDGRMQWARDGKALYLFAGDGNPGDTKGDGQGGVWHVVKVADKRTTAANAGYGASSYDYGYGAKP